LQTLQANDLILQSVGSEQASLAKHELCYTRLHLQECVNHIHVQQPIHVDAGCVARATT